MKEKLLSCHSNELLNVVRAISLCGDDIRRIVPEFIPRLDLSSAQLSSHDVIALSNVICNSTGMDFLSLKMCSLTSDALMMLVDGLRSSKLKVCVSEFWC